MIFVTARVSDEDEQGWPLAGAADYITKPLRPSILLARIRNHLKLKQAQDALRDYNTALESSVVERTATLSAVLDSADQLIVMITLDGAIMAINRIGAEQFGSPRPGWPAATCSTCCPPSSASPSPT